ncbi:hypothetical protein B0H14DRAFT_2572948 [Mycena olivaceomarginata]|nr:hypothetical protein B0H14DRAFT_2572948 [Mycena olivaceomarginata]
MAVLTRNHIAWDAPPEGARMGLFLSQTRVIFDQKHYFVLEMGHQPMGASLFPRPDGELVYLQFDPGAESMPLISGDFPPYTEQWLKYVVLNVTEYDISDYGWKHGVLSMTVNRGDISTFEGGFSAFQDRGGKFLNYHGCADPVIPSGSSKHLYNLISHTLLMPNLDSFYHLFLMPGRTTAPVVPEPQVLASYRAQGV